MADIGAIIQNKYEILKLIGKGGMSKVYLAMDLNLKKQWAVKEIQKNAMDKNNQVVIQSAMAEANMIKKLDHPYLPRIVDIIDREDAICVIMDFIEGEPLSSVLNRQGAQPQDKVIVWAKQLCQVLDYLHTRKPPIIYRDMKPANVMLQPDGNIKLIDFGIAREYKEQNLSDTVSLGTKGYAAPEQFGGKGQTDARTDIYCFGVTLYHLLTGKNPCEPPYEIYPIRYWNPGLSSGLESIILKCTQLNPEDRYQSCAEVLYALNHHNTLDERYRIKQKKKLWVFYGAVAGALLGAAVGAACQGLRIHNDNSDYDNNIAWAEKAARNEEKIDYYLKAVNIKPSDSSAYFGLIEAFKEDAAYTETEEAILTKVINKNITTLQKNEDYGQLAFEIGKLYWYYYDYGKSEDSDNQITRMKSAINWFDDAYSYSGEGSAYNFTAKVYGDIGRFNKEITLNVEEASDKGMYGPYWQNLNSLARLVDSEEGGNEVVSLEAYKLIIYSIESYARKFKADNISQEDLLRLFRNVKERTNDVEVGADLTDKAAQIKSSILNRLDAAEKAIANAFASKQGEGT